VTGDRVFRSSIHFDEIAMQTISAAIIGTGFMAPAHTEALRRLGVKVSGILGSAAVSDLCRRASGNTVVRSHFAEPARAALG
jgi:hypothetical protein